MNDTYNFYHIDENRERYLYKTVSFKEESAPNPIMEALENLKIKHAENGNGY